MRDGGISTAIISTLDIQILVEEEIGPNLRQRVLLGLLNSGGGSFALFASEVNLLLFAIIASVIRGLLSEVCTQADLCEGRIMLGNVSGNETLLRKRIIIIVRISVR